MLGNALTQEWLPNKCLEMRDKLVVMDHYLVDIHVARLNGENLRNTPSPLTGEDISTIEACENLLDTPTIYSFLRNN